MAEFFNVLPPDEARTLLLSHLTQTLPVERVAVQDALGRITAVSMVSPHALPNFRRSTMDGYAVRAKDTFGASETLPGLLRVVIEIPMGQTTNTKLNVGEAAVVHTGGMIPDDADAVVQIEHTQPLNQELMVLDGTAVPFEIEVMKSVAVGQNVLQLGEDVEAGVEILPAGHKLRPQDLGGLLALGITAVEVSRQPRIGILATGDEVISPDKTPTPGQIRDINSYTIGAMVQKAGGIPVMGGIIPDDFSALKTAAAQLLQACDMLVMSAGSSVSVRDMTVDVINQLGAPGVLLHGVATRPGKPTIIGVIGQKPVIGLPGNPVSAMVQFDMFGTPALYHLQGAKSMPYRDRVWAKLSQNVASESGREDYIPARLDESSDGVVATPIFGKSNLIYTLIKADGLLKIPLNSGGLYADEWVEIHLF